MKTILALLALFVCLETYSQVDLKIKQIDSLVSHINNSSLPVQRDTLNKDHPELGLKMTTYLEVIVSGNELMKYENHVISSRVDNGVTQQMNSSNTFYFDHNKLIKVEEYLANDDQRKEVSWYYSDDKPLYWTIQSDKAQDRAQFLLTMSKELLSKLVK